MSTWVLLRGWTREAAHWGDFPALLGTALPGARIVALDLPGCGRHHRAASPARIEMIVDACRAALAAQGEAPPFRLFGLSLGGMVAAHWAATHPQEVAACVLVNTSMRGAPLARLRPAAWPALLRIALAHDAAGAEAGILRLTSNRPAEATRIAEWAAIRRARPVSRGTAWRQLVAAARFALPARPPGVPCLVLCSSADRLVDWRCSRDLAAQWQAPLLVHTSAGHDLPLDEPEWVAAQLRSVHSSA
jgi:pimeloyl-ACP methyl ester carboxylesterase